MSGDEEIIVVNASKSEYGVTDTEDTTNHSPTPPRKSSKKSRSRRQTTSLSASMSSHLAPPLSKFPATSLINLANYLSAGQEDNKLDMNDDDTIIAESTNGLSRSKSVKSIRRKSFNYVKKTSKAENQLNSSHHKAEEEPVSTRTNGVDRAPVTVRTNGVDRAPATARTNGVDRAPATARTNGVDRAPATARTNGVDRAPATARTNGVDRAPATARTNGVDSGPTGDREGDSDGPPASAMDWLESTPGEMAFNGVVKKPLEEVKTLYFSPSEFLFKFHKDRGTTELESPEWQSVSGVLKRNVSYRLKTNIPVGPKTTLVNEIQTERPCTKAGEIYCIDIEANNHGFPYANTFTIFSHVCLHRETSTSCRIIIKLEIVYKKDVWGYIKGQIESNTVNGTKLFYTEVCESLNQYGTNNTVQVVGDQDPVRDPVRVRSRNKAGKKGLSKPRAQLETEEERVINGRGVLFLFILFMLFIMCMLNVIILTNLYLVKPAYYEQQTFQGVDEPSLENLLRSVNMDSYGQMNQHHLLQSDQEHIQLFINQMSQQPKVKQEIFDFLTLMISSLKQTEQVFIEAGAVLTSYNDNENGQSMEQLLRKITENKQNINII